MVLEDAEFKNEIIRLSTAIGHMAKMNEFSNHNFMIASIFYGIIQALANGITPSEIKELIEGIFEMAQERVKKGKTKVL